MANQLQKVHIEIEAQFLDLFHCQVEFGQASHVVILNNLSNYLCSFELLRRHRASVGVLTLASCLSGAYTARYSRR